MRTEKELLQLLNRGDEEGIRAVFDEFYDGLCLYAAILTKSHQVAEEIVEDLFIYLWINASTNTITTSLKSYLYTSIYHNCLKYLQKEKKEQQLNNQLRDLQGSDFFHSSSYINPESDLILQELEKKADAIMESLPGQCKEIYFLNRFENLTYSQIAEKLKITVGTVKTQMSRAFQKFRKEFKELLPVAVWLAIAADAMALTATTHSLSV
jgi:RNA polymerase sigma-70 factor (ECF subfamily)